jgi:hypothetical protein
MGLWRLGGLLEFDVFFWVADFYEVLAYSFAVVALQHD